MNFLDYQGVWLLGDMVGGILVRSPGQELGLLHNRDETLHEDREEAGKN